MAKRSWVLSCGRGTALRRTMTCWRSQDNAGRFPRTKAISAGRWWARSRSCHAIVTQV
jgi:hypothetical protein